MTMQPDGHGLQHRNEVNALAEELATVDREFDLLYRGLCDDCRSRLSNLFTTARRCFDLARLALDELGEPGERSTVGPASLQMGVANLLAARQELERESGLEIEVSHDFGEDCEVQSDGDIPRKVTQLLLASAAKSGARKVRIHVQELNDRVEIVYLDDGRGLSREVMQRVGFARHDEKAPADETVVRVRDLIHQVGGTVRWQGRKGVGTWVTVHLHKQPFLEESVPLRWGRSAVPSAIRATLSDAADDDRSLKTAGVAHAIGNDLAAMGIHIDLVAQQLCSTCRPRVQPMLDGSRLGLERARARTGVLHVSPIPADYGLTGLDERLDELVEALGAMGEAFGMTFELTRETSGEGLILVQRGGGRMASRKLIEIAARSGARHVHIHARELAESVEVTFADDGRGMTDDELDALGFAEPVDGPTVQEVTLLRRVILRIGGTVTWQSRRGVGTWVTTRIPKYRAASDASRRAGTGDEPGAGV